MPTEALYNQDTVDLAALGVTDERLKFEYAQGNRLNVFQTMSGATAYNFLPEPELKPTILIVERYRLSSFLGQYGVGRTIQTFSLLPGEKTTMSISSYKRSETKSVKASSILDSYTEEKADEFESTVMAEQSSQDNTTKNREYHAEAEAKASWGWGSAKVSGGVSGGSTSSREEFGKNVSSATEKHAASASAQRDIEINTTEEATVSTGEETAITREIQNINVGRTLNFTTRQMNQEFVTITHLVDVRLAFFNGFAESKDEVPLSEIDRLLEDYVVEANRAEAKAALLEELKVVRDYRDTVAPVIEEVPFPGSRNQKYWRFRKDAVSTYEDPATGTRIDVPGFIIDARKTVMRTDGMIVEALLGQASALDDYSEALQNEKIQTQRLENERAALANALEQARQKILERKDEAAAKVYATLYPPPVAG
jgi:hypothetical protein